MSKLLQSLLARALGFLCPGVDDPDSEPAGDPVDDDPDGSAEESDELDLDGDPAAAGEDGDPEPEPEPRQSRRDRAVSELRARAQAAEDAARKAEERIARFEAGQRPPVDPTFAEEEAKLRDANTSDLERWQIQSSRALRQSQSESRAALAQAADLSDKATYTQKSITKPIYAKYADRVEETLAKARAGGQNASRELVLQMLVGRDLIEGKLTKAPTSKPTIARGKPTGARSDTPRAGGQTEAQKRAARLANQII